MPSDDARDDGALADAEDALARAAISELERDTSDEQLPHMSKELLNEIFRFKHKTPSCRQGESVCEALARRFRAFVAAIAPVHINGFEFSALDPLIDDRVVPLHDVAVEEHRVLERACHILTRDPRRATTVRQRGDVWIEAWLPKYGCALQLELLSVARLGLTLVFLDAWEHVKHFPPDSPCVHSAVPTAYRSLNCGVIHPEERQALMDALWREIERAAPRTGVSRSAAFNDVGHQKTPQFIAGLLRIAKTQVSSTPMPVTSPAGNAIRGGTTDVGMHTGGQSRDTCWPLVLGALQQNLPGTGALFAKTVVLFKLSLVHESVAQLTRDAEALSAAAAVEMERVPAFYAAVDDAFAMLESAVLEVVPLVQRGYDALGLEATCAQAKQRIVDAAAHVNAATAKRFQLPAGDALDAIQRAAARPTLTHLTPTHAPLQPFTTRDDMQQHARKQLAFFAFIDARTCSAAALIKWLDATDVTSGDRDQQLVLVVLRTIETFVFSKATWLNSDATKSSSSKRSFRHAKVEQILETYDNVMTTWRSAPMDVDAVTEVEQRSRCLLVKWTAFCLAHQSSLAACPLLKDYGIALSWQHLDVAVVREQTAIDALVHVAQYIRAWNASGRPRLFDLTHPAPTAHFAAEYAADSTVHRARYKDEVHRLGQRVVFQWSEIATKKALAQALRDELQHINASLQHLEQLLRQEQARISLANKHLPYHLQQWQSSTSVELSNRLAELSNWRYAKEQALEHELQMPSFIVHPLPYDRRHALEALFFLDVPKDIAFLWTLCLRAQRALAPPTLSKDTAAILRDDGAKTTWLDHYSAYSSVKYPTGVALVGYIPSVVVPQSYGPWSIDDVTSQEEYAHRCVWYPSGGDTRVYWKDPLSSAVVNPFKITHAHAQDYFTPTMPPAHKRLQWAVAYPGGAARGNVVYAKVSDAPLLDGFDKTAFICFGSLRAFPHTQVRRIYHALRENALPWSHPCVRVVVRQAMFQVGELTDERVPMFQWKSDISSSRGVAVLTAALQHAADELALTPRNYADVPLLSELAGFVSQLAPPGASDNSVVATFVGMCCRWAQDVKTQYQSDRSIASTTLTELRAKECLLYGYALQSYGLGSMDTAALVEMGKLVVLFRHALLFSTGSSLWTELQHLEVAVAETMARRIVPLIETFSGNDGLLTQLVRLVNANAPTSLRWSSASPPAAKGVESYFDAIDESSGTHYALNLFSGLLLTDGSAAGGLPSQIRSCPRFRELFGDMDFDVAFIRGRYRTTEAVDDRFWDFAIVDNELRVRQEHCCDGVQQTLELCSREWLASLSETLPAQIVAMHSHWHWLERDCVLVRPVSALSSVVEYVISFTSKDGDKSEDARHSVECVQLPVSDKSLSLGAILERASGYLSFVRLDLELLGVLTKFEDAAFIHALRDATGTLHIRFPRFRLSFVLNAERELVSIEHDGYVLDPHQQFADAFPLFTRYLVLRSRDSAAGATSVAKSSVRILVPPGSIVRRASGMIDIAVSSDPTATLSVSVLETHHRLRTLSTETLASRLQLCVLLASASSSLPSQRFRMTGAEAALQVLHGCFVGASLSSVERELLMNLCAFGHREPGLKILASSILDKAERCAFFVAAKVPTSMAIAVDCADELDEYSAMCGRSPERSPLRTRLRRAEEKLLLSSMSECATLLKRTAGPLAELDPSPVKASYVQETERVFSRFLRSSERATELPPLPLTRLRDDAMGKEMNDELRESWRAFHAHADKRLATSLSALALTCNVVLKDVSKKRREVETYLFSAIAAAATSETSSRLLQLVNYVPTPTLTDIIRSSFDDTVLLQLPPRLSASARSVFRAATRQFMELCVLEDKLERLVASAQQTPAPSRASLLDELSTMRTWQSAEHPYWLAFEVEMRLQIRHEQYVVAQHLIANSGAVCQMNMGRGKTKVILPMLFLYYRHRHSERLVRAHFLTPLLSETRQFLHRHLSASSVLGLHFVELPFHRNIELSTHRLALLREDLEDANASGRFLMIAPEHRMSLELELLNLRASTHPDRHEMVRALEDVLAPEQYIDVLDESDAVLHHKYHLIYAIGKPQTLESGESRWLAAEALLRVLANTHGRHVQEVLRRPHVCVLSAAYASRFGAFNGLRLNATVEAKLSVRTSLRRALVLDLVNDPPRSLKWLQAFGSQSAAALNDLVQALTDPSMSLDTALIHVDPSVMRFRTELLALRGLLAFGILEHCLEKRHRVEFGLPDTGTRTKRMAIPFRAADIPSERSEFSHPDVGITLTVLAYYHTGLSEREMKEALDHLLQLGPSEQDEFYANWLASVGHQLPVDLTGEFPVHPSQLSPNDSRQFALLHSVYRFSMEAINFFLNTCVFPSDTTQYPQRLSRTAWNIAGGSWNIGFSGTNDNHRLLPLSVWQHEPNEPSLVGTNGKMIDRILRVFQGFEQVQTHPSASIPWQALLRLAMHKHAHALIDTGALLAGVLNNDAAAYLLELDGFRGFAGVTYYDTRKQFDCWVVLDASTKHVTPLKNATIVERDTFVIFDDARSRGSDMKLKRDAVAVLTLGPKLTKDKLMQGAGRMRQLGCDQTLWFVSLGEVAQSILQVCGKEDITRVGATDILDWVMDTTKREVVHGLIEWASSGLHFRKTQHDPDAELVEEDWSLEWLYSHAHRPERISTIVRSKARELFRGEDELDALVQTICKCATVYGLDEEVLVTAHDEECERELHNERFEEREDDAPCMVVAPATETVWAFDRVLRAESVDDLIDTVDVTLLSSFVRASVEPSALGDVDWDRARVFGTSNFFSTVEQSTDAADRGDSMSAFLRLVDAVLLFPDGSNLLLSELEADRVLELLWTASSGGSSEAPTCVLVHLSSVVDTVHQTGNGDAATAVLARTVAWAAGSRTSSRTLDVAFTTLCQLFNGDTMFAAQRDDAAVETALRTHLHSLRKREATLRAFAVVRGNALRWRYSFLHTLCHDMDLVDYVAPATRSKAPRDQPRCSSYAPDETVTAKDAASEAALRAPSASSSAQDTRGSRANRRAARATREATRQAFRK